MDQLVLIGGDQEPVSQFRVAFAFVDPLRVGFNKSEAYRQNIRRKLGAYERHIQLGLIAQGLMQYLALHFRRVAWFNLHTYMRTAVPQKPPSEWVVSQALCHTWPEFLRSSAQSLSLKKFLASKTDPRFCRYSDAFNLDKVA